MRGTVSWRVADADGPSGPRRKPHACQPSYAPVARRRLPEQPRQFLPTYTVSNASNRTKFRYSSKVMSYLKATTEAVVSRSRADE